MASKLDKKQPWLKFYTSDWRGDAKLRMCSIGARGLWVEMMCVMHEAEPYGHLVTDGKAVSNRQIAALAGVTLAECGRYLMELESAGVYSRTENKTIFSRRMVRDRAKADIDRENGKGGGNPRIGKGVKQGVNPQANPPDKAQIPEARIDDARTPARGSSMISQQAYDVTSELERAFGFHLPEDLPPGWHGCAMWVQKCLDAGWKPQAMIGAGNIISKRARTTINSYAYLEKPMAEIIADNERPLPKIEVKEQETVHVTANRTGGSDRSAQGAIARLRERIASQQGDDREPNPDAIRLISKG